MSKSELPYWLFVAFLTVIRYISISEWIRDSFIGEGRRQLEVRYICTDIMWVKLVLGYTIFGYHTTNLNEVPIFSIFKFNGFRIDCSDSFSKGYNSKEIHITVAPRS